MDIRLFKRLDVLVYLLVILLAVFLLIIGISGDEGGKICVTANGEQTYYSLNEDCTAELEGNGIKLTLIIKNGNAYVSHSECDDGICVASGKISKEGQIIVCAPAGISIKVVGKAGDYDAVTG